MSADFADTYPIQVSDAEGGTTLIVNTDNEYTYLGRLKVDFDSLGNIVVGVIGALLGGFVGSMLLGWDVTGFNLGSIMLAFLGAALFLLILRAIPGAQPFER